MSGYEQQFAAQLAGGKILSQVMREIEPQIVAGITTRELDERATKLIRSYGGEPGFQKVPGYSWASCMSVNEIVVHGIPNDYRLVNNDLLKFDIGVYYDGYHTDYGNTYCIGNQPTPEIKQFLEAGKNTLARALNLVKANEHIGKVSSLIEESIHQAGYEIIYNLTGHSVGRELHEDPLIPQFLEQPIKRTPRFKVGRAYAIEIIYSMEDSEIVRANKDGWSLRTMNRSQSAFWENTVLVFEDHVQKIVN